MSDSFGMMEGAYFVSKNDIITWINNLLKLNLTRVEQLGTGAVYAQILDTCFPGDVALYKLNWKARLEWEFINNFKVLQQAFQKHKINRHIEVEKLSKAKYQDNLEFAQWMKKFYENKLGKEGRKDYDPVAKRGGVEPDFSFIEHKIPTKINLDYTNFAYGPAEGGKRIARNSLGGVNSTTKKLKSNNGEGQVQNKENDKDLKMKLKEYSIVESERNSLKEKLSNIEKIVMNVEDKNDSLVVKAVRDYLGIIVQKPIEEKRAPDTESQDDKESCDEDLLANEQGDSKEILMLIEGESL